MSEPNNTPYTSPAKRVAEAPSTPTMGSAKRRILYTTKWSPSECDVSMDNSRELVGTAIEAKHGSEARPFHNTTTLDFQSTIKQVQAVGKVVHFTRAPLSPVRRNADTTPTRASGRDDEDDDDPFQAALPSTDTNDLAQQLKELRLNQERDAKDVKDRIAQLEQERDENRNQRSESQRALNELKADFELTKQNYKTLKDVYRSGHTLTLFAGCNRIVKAARLAKSAPQDTGGRGKKKSTSPKKSKVTAKQPHPPSDAHIQHRERADTLAQLQRETGCQLTNLIRFASNTDYTEERVQQAHLETSLSGLLKALNALLKITAEDIQDNDSHSYAIHQLALEVKTGLIWVEEEAEWLQLPLADIPLWYTTRKRQVPAEFAVQNPERPGF